MNSILLILCTLVIYVFGYRYFAGFVQKSLFKEPFNRTSSATTHPSIVERLKNVPMARHELLGFHFATIATLSTISGASVAIFWGWIPAYLWLLVASSVAAGSFAMGSLWLRQKSIEGGADNGAGSGLVPQVGQHLPAHLGTAFLVLVSLSLIGFIGLFVFFAAILLVSYPSVTWPAILLLVLVGLQSRVIANQQAVLGNHGTTYLVSILVVILSIWMSQGNTIGFSGSLNFDLSGASLVSVDGITVWAILILLFALFVQRKPFDDWQKNFGVLSAVMVVLTLLVFYIGIAIDHPPMSAPAFTGNKSPGLVPWLVITLTTGAYAGLHFLFAYCVTAPRMKHPGDLRYIGYGAALLEGLLALTVILVFGATIGDKDVWNGLYQDWSALPDGGAMLGHYVNGVVNVADRIGLSPGFTETWTTLVMISLSVVSAIALLRVFRVLLQELGVRYRAERLGAVKTASWTSFGLLLIAVILINGANNIKTLEQLLGVNQYLLASLGLLMITHTLTTKGLPPLPGWILLGISALLVLLGGGSLLVNWAYDFMSLRFAAGLALVVLELALLGHVGLTVWRQYQPGQTAPAREAPPEPPEN